jgi:hypothetical protein
MEEKGYEEDEYFFEGVSNVYSTGKHGKPVIKDKDCPYVNRMIVRKPKDVSTFSGNLILEYINPTSDMEIDRMWILLNKEIMRGNDIYVGFTSKPNTIKSLVSYNQERYGCLSWNNPTPTKPFPFSAEDVHPIAGKDLNIKYETGLVWDMTTDLASLLRGSNDLSPVKEYAPKRLILTGWSQSAGYVTRYVNSFDDTSNPHFDGYFAAGRVSFLPTPINQYEQLIESETAQISRCDVPFMSLQTESENANFGNLANKAEDSDSADFLYRNYEIAGGSHDTMSCYVDYYDNDLGIARIAHMLFGPPEYRGSHSQGNDYPYEFLFCAAYRNLFNWIIKGTIPNRADLIHVNKNGENIRDGFGNSVGGVRTCLLNYPTARYCTTDSLGKEGVPDSVNSKNEFSLFGFTKPFSAALLKELYSTLDNYRELVTEDTKRQVEMGFILPSDEKDLIDYAVRKAEERGLK